MALNSVAIANGIAALTVTGVTIKSLSNIPDIITVGECPILMPDENNWMSGAVGGPDGDGPSTFGPGMWEFQRDFGYIYLHSATGQKRSMSDHLAAISANIDAIQTALTTLNVAGVDVIQITCGEFGPYTDPSKQNFYGLKIVVTVEERINA
jgi:hypothetical protein